MVKFFFAGEESNEILKKWIPLSNWLMYLLSIAVETSSSLIPRVIKFEFMTISKSTYNTKRWQTFLFVWEDDDVINNIINDGNLSGFSTKNEYNSTACISTKSVVDNHANNTDNNTEVDANDDTKLVSIAKDHAQVASTTKYGNTDDYFIDDGSLIKLNLWLKMLTIFFWYERWCKKVTTRNKW